MMHYSSPAFQQVGAQTVMSLVVRRTRCCHAADPQ